MAGSEHDRQRTLGQAGIFATTHWSEVLTAGGVSSPAAQEALEQLCRTYWYPLYAYVRRQGHSPEDAQDLTQAFFAFILDKQVVGQADPQKGRFRSFLLSSLKHFLADERDRAFAQKRGGGKEVISLDAHRAEEWYHREPADTLTPDRIFERRWAVTVLEQALAKMRAEQLSTGKADQFEVLADYLLEDTRRANYSGAADRLRLSHNAVAAAIYRLRKRYRELVRAEVAQTVASPSDLEEEVRHLFAALGG
jgi:RNA polymerase sigma factor (sigma-70 family)